MKSYNDASSEAFLPGLAPSECGAETPGHQSDTTSRSGWWCRRFAEQILNSVGQPIGYRHQLMHGRKVVITGVGADFGRALSLQADFLNAQEAGALHQASTSSPEVLETPASSLPD